MKILCVCTGNTCRSPMLMALLRAEIGRRESGSAEAELPVAAKVQVESAGTAALEGEPASSYACTCMELRGLDLSGHRSRHIDDLDLPSYDRIWCMTTSHAAALRARGVPAASLAVVNAEHGGVPDPFGGSLDEYEACAQVLAQAARRMAGDLGLGRRI